MKKSERWLFTVALNMCVIPVAALGIIFQLLPDRIPIVILSQTVAETTSKYSNLVLCLFLLIPLSMLVLSTVLYYKKLVDRNYISVTVGIILITAVFTFVLLYCFSKQSDDYEYVRGIDWSTFVCCLLSMALSFIGTLLYGLKPNEVMGFRNRYTSASADVWQKTHDALSFTCNGMFALMAAVMSFFRSWYAIAVVVAAALVFVFAIVPLVSRVCFARAEHASFAREERENA